MGSPQQSNGQEGEGQLDEYDSFLSQVVKLRVGEAFVFSPSSIVDLKGKAKKLEPLGLKIIKVKIRMRLTADGGKTRIVV